MPSPNDFLLKFLSENNTETTRPVGVAPQRIFNQQTSEAPSSSSSSSSTASTSATSVVPTAPPACPSQSLVYGAIYSSVAVYEMMCRSIAVMRRRSDSFLVQTFILFINLFFNSFFYRRMQLKFLKSLVSIKESEQRFSNAKLFKANTKKFKVDTENIKELGNK